MAHTKTKPKKARNLHALNAIMRRTPKFKHKTAPKGGASNWRDQGEV